MTPRELQVTPRVFSPRQRRWNPFLRREDDNGVFEAFRRRRTVHRHGLVLPVLNLRVLEFAFLLVGSLMIIPALFVFGAPVICVTVLVSAVYVTIHQVLGHVRARRQTVRHVSSLIRSNGHNERMIRDLWITGATGGDIAEAIVLEHVLSSWISTILYTTVPAIVVSFILLLSMVDTRLWELGVITVALCYMVYHIAVRRWNNAAATCCGVLRARTDYMQSIATQSGLAGRIGAAMAVLIAKVFAFAIPIGFIGLCFGEFVRALPGDQSRGSTSFILLSIAAGIICVGYVLKRDRRTSWVRSMRKYFRTRRDFIEMYDTFVRVAVLGDESAAVKLVPDGAVKIGSDVLVVKAEGDHGPIS